MAKTKLKTININMSKEELIQTLNYNNSVLRMNELKFKQKNADRQKRWRQQRKKNELLENKKLSNK